MEQILWAAVGATFGLALQVAYEFLSQLRTPTRLFGVWHSTWQPTVTPGWEWVTEKLEIRQTLRGIRLLNRNNSRGYEWKGKAQLVDNTYLIGEWVSLKPGSNAEGIFALTFSTDGNCLLGFFLTRDVDRTKIASSFVLGRTTEDMAWGRNKLQSLRIKYPKSWTGLV